MSFALVACLIFQACTSRRTEIVPQSAPTEPLGDTQSDDTQSDSTANTSPVFDENLFDPNVSSTETSNANTSGDVVSPNSDSGLQACIDQGRSPYTIESYDDEGYYGFARSRGSSNNPYSPYYTNSSSSSSSALATMCLDSSKSDSLSADYLYKLGLLAVDHEDACLQRVLAIRPRTEAEAELAHHIGALFLVRCYRKYVNDLKQQALFWQTHQSQAYKQTDDSLSTLLFLLSFSGGVQKD